MATNGGRQLIDSESTTKNVLSIQTPATTTGNIVDVSGDALTTGSILELTSDSDDTSARPLVDIIRSCYKL